MEIFEWIAGIYLAVVLLIILRLTFVAKRFIKSAGVEVKIKPFYKKLLIDGILWPYYFLWYGLKASLEDLK